MKALLFITLCLLFITSVFANIETTIPDRAHQYLPIVYSTIDEIIPDHPYPPIIPALIEHESCITLTHSRCWSPTSRLHTPREEGAGLGQLTRAFRLNPDGSRGELRFDTLSSLSKKYPSLRELSWSNIYESPELQIRAIGYLYNENWKIVVTLTDDVVSQLAFANAAYNGGIGMRGGLNGDISLCRMTAGCDPTKWFNNVENTCSKSSAVLYGNRSACDINRHHARSVLKRSIKYAEKY